MERTRRSVCSAQERGLWAPPVGVDYEVGHRSLWAVEPSRDLGISRSCSRNIEHLLSTSNWAFPFLVLLLFKPNKTLTDGRNPCLPCPKPASLLLSASSLFHVLIISVISDGIPSLPYILSPILRHKSLLSFYFQLCHSCYLPVPLHSMLR